MVDEGGCVFECQENEHCECGEVAVRAAREKTPPAGTRKVSWLLGYAAALAAVEKEWEL